MRDLKKSVHHPTKTLATHAQVKTEGIEEEECEQEDDDDDEEVNKVNTKCLFVESTAMDSGFSLASVGILSSFRSVPSTADSLPTVPLPGSVK